MLSRVQWPVLVVIGGVLNVIVNYGYKVVAADTGVALLACAALAVTSITLLIYAALTKTISPKNLLRGKTPFVVVGVGLIIAAIFVCFLQALTTGPISIIDPLWACIYALGSLALGMTLIRERPNKMALAGIALYLAGAILMGWGQA